MVTPILATKLHAPHMQAHTVSRPHLIKRLDDGLHGKLTLVSAPAGFGKTTLLSEWATVTAHTITWLSLDEDDSDPTRFLAYLIAALQAVDERIGQQTGSMLQTMQPPAVEMVLTTLINDVIVVPEDFVLVLDDYHLIEAAAVNRALAFLLEHLPSHMHLVIAAREDPQLPLARYRGRGQLAELRATDLRFNQPEASLFLNEMMDLNLSQDEVTALENRTEGWIVGLKLAALSLRDHQDRAEFIAAFTGSHRFVLDYLLEEVLHQQPENVQVFLLHTSILDRLCGPLCEALIPGSGQEMLEYLERTNLFIIPLDNERQWYRYHHLFADLLRQRLHQHVEDVTDLHNRASRWYEDSGLRLAAFHHATAANNIERALLLVHGDRVPLHFQGGLTPVLNWLESLPKGMLDAHPGLWVMYASALSIAGERSRVELALQAAEAALVDAAQNDHVENLIGHIAAIRAVMAVGHREVDTVIAQSQRALKYLHPDNLSVRTATIWKLGVAYQFQGNREAASQAYSEAATISQATANTLVDILASTGLGQLQEANIRLHLAAQTYRHVLDVGGDPPSPITCDAHLGLARILYEWNEVDAARQYAQQGYRLARSLATVDTVISAGIFLARLKLSQGDFAGAVEELDAAEQSMHQHEFVLRQPDIITARVRLALAQSQLAEADRLAQDIIPRSQARVHLARGAPDAALTLLAPLRQQAEATGYPDERLKVMVLQALGYHAQGDEDEALAALHDALALARPGGFIRTFIDEGPLMDKLLAEAASRGVMPDYANRLLEASRTSNHPFIDPLSEREMEVLHLIAEGLSNREIGDRLFIALDTVKGHTRRIYGKLQVNRRTEAVARAREAGLL